MAAAAVGGSGEGAPGRLQRLLVGLMLLGLLVATAAAFAITENLKLTRSPILGTQVSKLFSPVCHCATASASIAFRLRRRGDVEVDVVDATGAHVRRLVRQRLGPGFASFRWSGHSDSGQRSKDGAYRIRVRLFTEHRTIELPNVIRLITVAPSVRTFSSDRPTLKPGKRLRLSYRFSAGAHPLLLVDGRTAVYGRFAHRAGTLDWYGKIGGLSVAAGRHTLALEARDDAGNTSSASTPIIIRVDQAKRVGRVRSRRHTRSRTG